MKRLVLFSVAMLMAGFGAQSCMDNNIEPDPMAGGWEIYRVTRSQQNCAMDGANIAFRLNILLTEAVKQYTADPSAPINLSELMVGDVNVSAQLFRSGTEFDPATYDGTIENSYKITYKDGSTDYDYRRKGGVIVNTEGYLLSDPTSNSWSVSVDPDNPVKAYLGYDPYTGTDVFAVVDFGNYEIYLNGANQWVVDVTGYASYMDLNWGSTTPITSDWSASMTITTNFDEWDYSSLKLATSKIDVTGMASGETMYWSDSGIQWEMSYEIPYLTPMVYRPSNTCGWNYFESATEKAKILNSITQVDSSIFPSLEVSIGSVLTGCSIRQTITYNGMVQ